MSMVIQHNIPALQTYNIVNNTSNALQKSIAKLSSGLRINSAADDAAGLAISEKMRAQVRGLDRAVSNTQDGISLIQTAEGALQETHSILQRMRELAVQGANDTLTQQDRTYIQEEIDQLKDEITRIGNTTQFNKKKLINGESSALWSSSDSETKALIRGGLRDIDQFGQKSSVEGNYKIRVKAEPGQAEVQKSDIMTIKHPNVLTNKTVKADDGIKDVTVNNMTPGTYSLKLTDSTTTAANDGKITGAYGVGGEQEANTEYTATYTAGTTPMVSGSIAKATDASTPTTKDYTVKLGNNEWTLTVENTDTTKAMEASGIAANLAKQITEKAADKGVTIKEEDLAKFLVAGDGKTTLTATAASESKLGDLSVASSGEKQYSNTLATSGTTAIIGSGQVVGASSANVFKVTFGSALLDDNGNAGKTYTITNPTASDYTVAETATALAELVAADLADNGVTVDATQLATVFTATTSGTSVTVTSADQSKITGGTGTFAITRNGTAITQGAALNAAALDTSYTTTYTAGDTAIMNAAPTANTSYHITIGTDSFDAVATTASYASLASAISTAAATSANGGYVIDATELEAFLQAHDGSATLNIKSDADHKGGTLTIRGGGNDAQTIAKLDPTSSGASNAVTAKATIANTTATTTYTAGTTAWIDTTATTPEPTANSSWTLKIGDDEITATTVAGTVAQLATNLATAAAGEGYGINATELATFLQDATGKKTLTIVSSADQAGQNISLRKVGATTDAGSAEATTTTGTSSSSNVSASDIFTVKSTANNTQNASILFEVMGKDENSGSVTLKATATMLDQNGKVSSKTMDDIVVTGDGDAVNLTEIFGGSNTSGEQTVTVELAKGFLDVIDKGGMFVASVKAGGADADNNSGINVQLTSTKDDNWANAWDNGVFNGETPEYFLNGEALSDLDVNFTNYILNEKTGEVSQGTVTLSTDKNFSTATDGALTKNDSINKQDTLASFTTTYIGKTATGDVKLRDLDKFWNSEGTFLLDDAKTLTLNQGDGKTASITLYANDTLDEVATKLNNAIAEGLGQSTYVDNATHFATFVSDASEKYDSEAVNGTFVIRSVVPGKQGEITFSGDENVLNALSLNTIQDSKETVYNVDVLDEHTGKLIAQNVKTTSNVMYGVIHDNVDVEFGALSGVSATWNENMNKYTYDTETTESTLHIADNTTVLQIGANEGEDLAMDIGDMRSHALGIDGVNVMSHDRAGRAITLIDNAIDKVSTQRAKLGAYQNRLEYTASSLTTASENLTSAESRIRDADMAKEMMEFTKLNIMLQAGNSMLAQANQQPQNVLSLIR